MQNIDKKQFMSAGDTGLYVTFQDCSDDDALLLSRQLGRILTTQDKLSGIVDVTPGLKNLLVHYDPVETSFATVVAHIETILPDLKIDKNQRFRHWRIPVLYGGEAGPDLEEVAASLNISPDEVVEKHLANILTVAIMGFLPGLAYMKGVDASLYLPRRPSPRQLVEARSVGIAMDQTVIYPLASPGGWNLIGQTPIRPFDASREEPVLFNSGDHVQFIAIDGAEFQRLDQASQGGEMVITPEEVG